MIKGKVLQLFDITSLSVPTLDDSHGKIYIANLK